MTKITLTEKIEINVDGSQEEKDSFYEFLWKNSKNYVKALNMVYSQLMFDELVKDSIKEYDEKFMEREQVYKDKLENLYKEKERDSKKIEKCKKDLSKLRSGKTKEASEILTNAIGLKSLTRTRDIGKRIDFDYSDFIDSANSKANQDFSNDYTGIKTGQVTPRNYKNKNKQAMLPFRGRDIKLHKDEKRFYISIPKGFRFKVYLGVKPSRARRTFSVLENVYNDNYTLNQSKLIFKDGKLYLYMTVTFEKDYQNLELDKEKELIVSFSGLAMGSCTVNNREVVGFGDSEYIKNYKMKIKAMKSREQSRGVFSKGGHGRKRKLDQDKWEAVKVRESNFVKTYNNQCTAKIIQTAIRNKSGIIRIEEPNKEYGDWAYYQFVEQLKQKAIKFEIEVYSY